MNADDEQRVEVQARRAPGLHICPRCESDLVQPITWAERPDGRRYLELECPNCWWHASIMVEDSQMEILKDELDAGLSQLLNDLRVLSKARVADEIDQFARALATGAILPEDF
jgi:hypothetical protein